MLRASLGLRVWRTIYQNLLAWLYTAVHGSVLLLVLLLSFGRAADTLGHRMVRGWGKAMLWIYGVRVVVLDDSQLKYRANRLFAFNHSSTLDIFLGCALSPPGGVPVTKKELLYVPFLGQAIYFLGFVTLDRKKRERAVASLKAAGKRMREERLSAIIAPEGTRSVDGKLGPFKLGPFHLALHAGASVMPVIFHNADTIWPRTQAHSNTGTVIVNILPAIDTSDYTEDNLREKADALRDVFVAELAKGPPALPTD